MHYSRWTILKVFLQRIGRCRGFGIQSPTDFSFVNDVVYERAPYYAYKTLLLQHPQVNGFDLKLARTLFRICNYAHPSAIIIPQQLPPHLRDYLSAACPNSSLLQTSNPDTASIQLRRNTDVEGVTKLDCIFLLDIHAGNSDEWEQLMQLRQDMHLIMYDFYYFGIAFVRERRYSEVHIVNFY